MKIFVTADNHFDHTNIIKHCNRPFRDVNEMNETMIDNWNRVVSDGDRVYVIGDFAWKNPEFWLKQLKGNKILIKGNHDHKQNIAGWFYVRDKLETKIEGQKLTLHHYQQAEWESSFHGSWHLYGHSHGNAVEHDHKLSFDVGVDLWDFTPIEWPQIQAKMRDKETIRKMWQDNQDWVPHKNRVEITKNNRKYWK